MMLKQGIHSFLYLKFTLIILIKVVSNNSSLLAEWRAHSGFTDVRGQCYYCGRICKTLSGLKLHHKTCRANPKISKYLYFSKDSQFSLKNQETNQK